MNRFIVLIAAVALANTGCSTMSNTEKGVGLGGAIGAGLGTGIGAITGNPKTGAVVGGLVGAGVGGLVGNEEDKKDVAKAEARADAEASAVAQANPPLGLIDVVNMSQKGMDPNVIINQIHQTGSTFQITKTDLDYLYEQRVDSRVIQAMQNARTVPIARGPAPRTVYVREPRHVIVEQPVYLAPPPPPVIVPVAGFHYHRRW